MTTPITRGRFLATLAGLAVAPVIAARALAAAKAAPTIPLDLVFDTKEADRLAAQGRDHYGHPRGRPTMGHVYVGMPGFHGGDWIVHQEGHGFITSTRCIQAVDDREGWYEHYLTDGLWQNGLPRMVLAPDGNSFARERVYAKGLRLVYTGKDERYAAFRWGAA